MVIFYDDKVDYCRVTTDDSEISPMIRTTKSEFETIMANSGWLVLEDKQEQKQTKGLVKLYKVRGQSFGVCAVYCGDNVQWTKMIEDVPQNWSTTLRTIFEDQWSGNLEEDINTAFPMFDGNIEYHNNSSYTPQNLVQSFPVIYILFNFVYNEMSRCVFEQIIKYADLVELPPIA